MKKRITKPLLIILTLLLAAGCAPVEIEQPVPAAEIGSISATVTEVAAPPPTPSSTAPPAPTKTPYPTTPTPDPALPPWTREPSPTPTIQPTFTPIPGSVWPILFYAVPCQEPISSCGTELFMDESPRWFLVNSDGTNLLSLTESDTYLADIWGVPYFSPDKFRLAYLARSDINDQPYLALTDVKSGQTINLGQAPPKMRELAFLPDPDCVIIFADLQPQPNWTSTGATLEVQRLCSGTSDPQFLDLITFPGLRHGYRHTYRLSPEGDALLVAGLNNDDIYEVYIDEFANPEPPRLIFTAEDKNWSIDKVRWQPNGQFVEFITQRYHGFEDNVTITYYENNRQGDSLRILLQLQLPIAPMQGSWSPDGQQLAFFSVHPDYKPATSGVYILNLETGEWFQILSGFFTIDPFIQAFPINTP